jgi:hypothetical protein
MMTLTTPQHQDVVGDVPVLERWRRAAVRLHPRNGTTTANASSIGGPFMLDESEEWPYCSQRHQHPDTYPKFFPSSMAMVPVAQLWQRDVPEVPFPEAADLLQLLWCPLIHEPDGGPSVLARWIDSRAVVGASLHEVPVSDQWPADFVPAPCVLSPERIIDLPDESDLPAEIEDAIADWSNAHGLERHNYPEPAPGSKVGGWELWINGADRPTCSVGHPMRLMLTIASVEFDPQEALIWQPAEEQGTELGRLDVGLCLGDLGSVFVFVCEECPSRPVASWLDS